MLLVIFSWVTWFIQRQLPQCVLLENYCVTSAMPDDVKCFYHDMEHYNANAYLVLKRWFLIHAAFIFYYIVNILILIVHLHFKVYRLVL